MHVQAVLLNINHNTWLLENLRISCKKRATGVFLRERERERERYEVYRCIS